MSAFLLAFSIAITAPEVESTSCEELMGALRTLRSASFSERWPLLTEDVPHLQELIEDSDALEPCRQSAEESLRKILEADPDDRVVSLLIDDAVWDCDSLGGYALEALSDTSSNVRRRAAEIFVYADCPEALPRLREMWKYESNDEVRRSVLRAIGSFGEAADQAILEEAATSDQELLVESALEAIETLPDARSVPLLESIASTGSDWRAVRAAEVLLKWQDVDGRDAALDRLSSSDNAAVASLARLALNEPERIPEFLKAGGHQVSRTALPLVLVESDPVNYGSFTVRPPEGDASVRCWSAPGYADPGAVKTRLPAGTVGNVEDWFEWKGRLWYAAAGQNWECWLPADVLVDGSVGETDFERGSWEFDLPISELSEISVSRAVHAGIALLFDPTDEVIGVRLEPAKGDRARVRWLTDAFREATTPFAGAISVWLRENASAWVGDRELEAKVVAISGCPD